MAARAMDRAVAIAPDGDSPVLEGLLLASGTEAAGAVVAAGVVVRYRPGLPVVLKGVSFALRGGESVGVCGRTGAGKSTLFYSLFRIIERCGGTIAYGGSVLG